MKYVFHLIPPQELCSALDSFNKRLGAVIIKPTKLYHCTLMTARLAPSSESAVAKTLETIAFPPFKIKTGSLEMFGDFGENTLALRLEPNAALAKLHYQIINAIAPHIVWEETPKLSPEFEGDAVRKQVYTKYGSQFYAQFYNPHISLGIVQAEALAGIDKAVLSGKTAMIEQFYFSRKQKDWKMLRQFKAKPY